MAKGSRPGEHRGGRKPGKPNKKSVELSEKLAALKCDPIEGMARIAMDTKNEPALRGKMFSELARYVHPQRKATEHTIKRENSMTYEELLSAQFMVLGGKKNA